MKVISEASIKTLAGDASYERGLAYYNNGKVFDFQIKDQHVAAMVEGSMPYRVELHHTAKIFEGSCSCPASDHFDFCKHCVAVALQYYYSTQTNQEFSEQKDVDSVEHYLGTLTKPRLVDELYHFIRNDSESYELWKLQAELVTGQLGAKDVRKHITKALPFKSSGLWRYSEVASYFSSAEKRLRSLAPAFEKLSSTEVIKLIVYAYERLEKTLHTIDDSGGYRFDVMALLKSYLQKAFKDSGLDANAKVKLITGFYTNSKYTYELLRDDADLDSLLNSKERTGLTKALHDFWKKEPSPNAEDLYRDLAFNRVESALLALAKDKGDTELELELLAKSAVSVSRCLDLVKRCIELKLIDQAESWQRYASQFENLRLSDISAIEHSQIQLWLAKGELGQAIKAQWAYFEEEESLEALNDVLATAKQLDERSQWLSKGIGHLQTLIPTKQTNQRDVDRCETLVAIYLNERQIDRAIDIAHKKKLSPATLMGVVNQSPVLGRKQSQIAERAINYLVDLGSQQTYERAMGFINKLSQKKASPTHQFKQLINALYQRPDNKRKINFIKLFKADFENLLD